MASLVRYCWGDLIAAIEGKPVGKFCPTQFPDDLRASDAAQPADAAIRSLEATDAPSQATSCFELNGGRELSGAYPHGQFGTASAVGQFHGDNRRQLVISAPYAYSPLPSNSGSRQPGKIFIYASTSLALIQELSSPESWVNEAHFGASLLSLDVNGDGIDDLVVGAPSHSLPGHHYRGRVWLYLGSRGGGLAKLPSAFLEAPEASGVVGFGQVLKAADLNGDGTRDLVVGSPNANSQAGMVCVRLTRPALEGMDWCVSAPEPRAFEHFGSSIDTVVADNRTWLVVGAPGGTGKVYAFDVALPHHAPVVLATGAPGTRFGASLAVLGSSPLRLAIGAPAETSGFSWQAGCIYQLTVPPGSVSGELQRILTGSGPGSSLGLALVADPAINLLASEPLANWEAGLIHNISPDATSSCLRLAKNVYKSRLGSSLHLADVDGDGRVDLVVGLAHFTDPKMA